jgi:hypothetical protein
MLTAVRNRPEPYRRPSVRAKPDSEKNENILVQCKKLQTCRKSKCREIENHEQIIPRKYVIFYKFLIIFAATKN